jgi:spore germination cell wall hydrolase CwlJ-like protein
MIALAPPAMLAALRALSAADLGPRDRVEDLLRRAPNVYHEARGESVEGQHAIAHVTLDRARRRAFPASVCGVVSQCAGRSCQFGWWSRASVEPREPQSWARALDVAAEALAGENADPTRGAHYFVRADRPTPSWARRFTQTATIGTHRFLRR